MKNILIVTYYYEPFNIIATRRPFSWANYLSKENKVTVLTRSWTGAEKGAADTSVENPLSSIEQINENLKVISIPYLHYKKSVKKNVFSSTKLSLYYTHFFGKFKDVQFIEENFKEEIIKIIKRDNIQLVVYSINPYLFLPVSKKVFEKTGVKYILDFRDVPTTMLLKKPAFKEVLYNKIMLVRFKSYIKYAAATLSVSKPIVDILKKISKAPSYVIYNGYDDIFIENILKIKEDSDVFNISYTGSLNPQNDLPLLLEGLADFCKQNNPEMVFNFVGPVDKYSQQLEKYKNLINFNYLPWLPHRGALSILRKSSVLVAMPWHGHTGIYSGKIFEYLGLQRTILLVPGDKDVIQKLVEDTNAGYSTFSATQISETLSSLYKEWKKNGSLSYQGNISRISEYTRNNQSKKFAEIVKNL